MIKHETKISFRDVYWSYLGYFLNFSVNLIVLPAILKFLTEKQLGLWYVFITISNMVQLLDFGFSPVIQRNITYVWNGVSKIRQEGLYHSSVGNKYYNVNLMGKVLLVSNRIYFLLSSIILFLLATVGTIYVSKISRGLPQLECLGAWLIYAFGTFSSVYWGRWIGYLSAIGFVARAQKVQIVTKLLYIVFIFVGLSLGGGLLVVALSFVLSNVIPQLFVRHYFLKIVFDGRSCDSIITPRKFVYFWRIIWFNAKKYGWATLAGVISSQSLMLICSYFWGLETCGEYGLSLQLLTVAATIGSVMFHAYFPALNAAQAANRKNDLRNIFSMTITAALIIMFLGCSAIVLLGDWVLVTVGISKQLLPSGTLILLAINLILERNTQLCCGMISTGNRVPFAHAALISSIIVLIMSLGLAMSGVRHFSALIITAILVQGCYNYWRWPYEVCRQLRMNPMAILFRGSSLLWNKGKALYIQLKV